jgi:hypothetical protein
MNDLALELFARGTGISSDDLLCLAIVRLLSSGGWTVFDPISPDPDELAETMIYVADREGVHPRAFVSAAIMDLMLADDDQALLIRSHPPSTAIH